MSLSSDRDSEKLFSEDNLEPEQARELIHNVARRNPQSLPALCLLIVNQRSRLRADLQKSEKAFRAVKQELESMRDTPWYPGEVLGVQSENRVEVAAGGRRMVLRSAPDIDLNSLQPGDEVFLNSQLTTIVARNEHPRQTGLAGTIADIEGQKIIVRAVAGDHLVATCCSQLRETLEVGDRVLYRPETHTVISRLRQRRQGSYDQDELPLVTFDDIGGLDQVISELKQELEPHLNHPELVSRYHLEFLRGVVLVGPPGVGKTMIAAATARHIATRRPGTGLINVRPGALRGSYYGETEERIRELFAEARRRPDLTVIFFDELDNFGTRGVGIGQDIDGRVLGSLLVEISSLQPEDNVFCIAATNRLDLCDQALVRGGRLGSKIIHIGRPNRKAAEAILERYLTADLPYRSGCSRSWLVHSAASYLYAPNAGAGTMATVTLANGDRREIRAPDVVSGALISNAVERAKHAAVIRHLEGDGGLALEDLLCALDEALAGEREKLRVRHVAARLLDFPAADEIVRVELPREVVPPRHQYLRAV